MTNNLQVKQRMDMIQNRMVNMIKNLSNQINSNAIKTEAEVYHLVFQTLQKFYMTIGKPTLEPIPAIASPYKDDHNTMMMQVYEDLYRLYEEINYITADTEISFERVELERQSFLKRIRNVEGTIADLESKLKKKNKVLVFQDRFRNVDNYLKEAVKGNPAYLSTEESILCLFLTYIEELNSQAKITIIKGNGLPGNTHIARSIGNRLKFDGEDELHINLAHILDKNADTWFEYELFSLGKSERELTKGYNLHYKEDVAWVEDEIDALRCVMKIELETARKMNWLSLSPYIPNDKGALACKIEKVVISDEKGTLKGFGYEESFNRGLVFLFEQQTVKTITIYMRQDTAYPITIGHSYYKQVNLEETSVFNSQYANNNVRVEGEKSSIELLGVSYNTTNKEVVYPIVKSDNVILNEDIKKEALFTFNNFSEDKKRVISGIEQLNSSRYMIGLRSINLANQRFAPYSEYVSRRYVSNSPMSECTLNVSHTIPDNFTNGDWIRYFISVDDGQSWHRIYPKNELSKNAKTKYLFNSKTPKNGRLDGCGYIEMTEEIESVQVKIELARPREIDNADFYTPYVSWYELEVLTKDVDV